MVAGYEVRLTAACGCGRDDRNGSSVDGFQVPGLMTTSMRFVGYGKAVPAALMSLSCRSCARQSCQVSCDFRLIRCPGGDWNNIKAERFFGDVS